MNNRLAEKLRNLACQSMSDDERCRKILALAEEMVEPVNESRDNLYLTIIHKIAQEYFRIFYVDIRTDRFLSYDPFDPNDTFEEMEDFFLQDTDNDFTTLYYEDVESYREAFKKERILQDINDHGEFSLIYRVEHQNGYFFVNMKGYKLEDDPDHIIVGVKNIDADVRREKEYLINLEQARDEANRDALTGIRNRHAYLEYVAKLEQQIEQGEVTDYAIIVFDINGLKKINDTLGHQAGDRYIKEGCSIICGIFKRSPVFRVGGDEFVVIAKGDDYVRLDHLLDQVEYSNRCNAAHGGIVIAVGRASAKKNENIKNVFERADAEMYENKKRLKNNLY